MIPHSESAVPSQTVPTAGVNMFKYLSLWETLFIQATTSKEILSDLSTPNPCTEPRMQSKDELYCLYCGAHIDWVECGLHTTPRTGSNWSKPTRHSCQFTIKVVPRTNGNPNLMQSAQGIPLGIAGMGSSHNNESEGFVKSQLHRL